MFTSYCITVFVCLSTRGNAWRQYAEPLQMATPNSDGIYEFNMVIAHKLTMSVVKEFGHRDMADYRVDHEKGGEWRIRSADQLESCNNNRPLNRSEDNLDSLLQLHGQHQRVIAINGNSPGSAIVVPMGAEVVMRVRNRLLSEGVTLHLHGMDKQGMWYTDGVAFVQQCPIAVASSHAYRFIVDTPGTHWYHGHMATDRGEGLLGAFIVIKPGEELRNARGENVVAGREYAVVLQDWSVPSAADSWYLHIWETMKWCYGTDGTKRCWAPTRVHDGTNVGGAVPLAAILINDKGWHNQDDVIHRPSSLPLETFRIRRGENVRLRIINGGVAHGLMVSIGSHHMTVIAADGSSVHPMEVDFLIVFPGERYDVIVEGLSNPNHRNYFMMIETLEKYTWAWQPMRPTFGLAKLEYEGISNASDRNRTDLFHSHCTNMRKCRVLNCPFAKFPAEIPLHCISVGNLRSTETVTDLELLSNSGFTSGYQESFINMHYDSHTNGWMFRLPRAMPYFHHENENAIADWCDPQRCPPGKNTSRFDENCGCFYHLNITLGNIVQLTIYNMGEGGSAGTGYAHPLHIHGTHFYLMKVAYPSYDHRGIVAHSNTDLPCSKQQEDSRGHCNDLRWKNTTWIDGRVPGMNTVDPSFRDTVVVPVGGYITIRFRAGNPGWFYAHCHLMLHHMGGTAFALRVGEHNQMPEPPGNFPHDCGDYEPLPVIIRKIPSPSSANTPRS